MKRGARAASQQELDADTRCDVVIIGGGITGALVAGEEASWFRYFAIDRPDPARF